VRTLALPKAAEPWSLTSLSEKLINIGAKVVSHGRPGTFWMAEVVVSRQMFQETSLIARLWDPVRTSMRGAGVKWDKRRQQRCALMQVKQRVSAPCRNQLISLTT
jgi:hypothetical protein